MKKINNNEEKRRKCYFQCLTLTLRRVRRAFKRISSQVSFSFLLFFSVKLLNESCPLNDDHRQVEHTKFSHAKSFNIFCFIKLNDKQRYCVFWNYLSTHTHIICRQTYITHIYHTVDGKRVGKKDDDIKENLITPRVNNKQSNSTKVGIRTRIDGRVSFKRMMRDHLLWSCVISWESGY